MLESNRTYRLFCLSLLALLSLPLADATAQSKAFPHHCAPHETVFLSARMTKGLTAKENNGKAIPEKILSLCTDKPRDPVEKMSYRYGPIGSVELERVATPSKKFGYYADFDSQVILDQVDLTIYRGEGWMGHGVSLYVYRGKKELMYLFSGTDDEVDFYMPFPVTPKSIYRNPFPLTAKSVLEERKPKHPFYLD